MSERVVFPEQEAIPGVEWPEPIQPELPLGSRFEEWSDADLVSLLDDLHSDLVAIDEKTASAETRYEMNKAFDEVWDYAIDRGIVS